MKNIIRNTVLIFQKNKEFIYLITVQPIMIFLLMSFLLPYSTAHNIAVINTDSSAASVAIEESVKRLEGVEFQNVKLEDAAEKLLSSNIELAVVIRAGADAPQVEIMSLGNSEVERAVTLCVEQARAENPDSSTTEVNAVKKKGMTVANSLGFMIFKTLTSANLLAALIIQERNRRMRDRILLSKITTGVYLGGMALVYLFFMMLGSVVYYLAGLLFRFDFGMRHSIGFLLVLFTANVLSVALYLFASTLVKKEDSLWPLASFVILPMSLFSGVLFPYEFMPKAMKAIGACMPQRWIAHGIEQIQETGSIAAGLPDMALVLGLSAILYIAAVIRTKRIQPA